MAKNVGSVLEAIERDIGTLKQQHERLKKAYAELDERITALGAGLRIEPYVPKKGSPEIGFRRFHDGWHITTLLTGIADITSEIPVIEATAEVQTDLVAHLPGLLEKLHGEIADRVKASKKAAADAEEILKALR